MENELQQHGPTIPMFLGCVLLAICFIISYAHILSYILQKYQKMGSLCSFFSHIIFALLLIIWGMK